MEQETMTLKEAAEVLGLTKAGVAYHLRMMGVSADKDAKGRIIITEDMISKIRAQRTAEGSQALHAATAKLLQDEKKKFDEVQPQAETDPEVKEDPTPQKRGLWARIFGR